MTVPAARINLTQVTQVSKYTKLQELGTTEIAVVRK